MAADGLNGVIDRLAQRRALRRWRHAAATAGSLDVATLRALRGQARALRRSLDQVLHVAEERLALPLIGAPSIRRPPGCDWVWRPPLWSGPIPQPGLAALPSHATLGEGATVFHDCRISEITARQIRNTRETDLAPYGLRLDVFAFDGSFLSLVLDLPEAGVQGLRTRHLFRIDAIVETEKPLEIFVRLNIKHGPNVEQMVQELPRGGTEAMVEFDLAYTKINERRVERAWADIIFEGPQLNQIVLRDLTLSRRPRADL
jgi:hypothetical protein